MDLIKFRQTEITKRMDIEALTESMKKNGEINEEEEKSILCMPSQKGKMAKVLRLLSTKKKIIPGFWRSLKESNEALFEEIKKHEEIDLGGNRKVKVTLWQGVNRIHIREYTVRVIYLFIIFYFLNRTDHLRTYNYIRVSIDYS